MGTRHLVGVLALLATVALSACASSPERLQYRQQELAIYEKHAGAEVDRIRSFRLSGWQSVSNRSLLLEARLNEWYLVDVFEPCLDLPFATTIGVKTSMNVVQAKFDSILVNGQQCRIERIRPIDQRAVRDELKVLREQAAG